MVYCSIDIKWFFFSNLEKIPIKLEQLNNKIIAKVEKINTPETAQKLVGKYIYIEKKKLRIHEKQACAACGQAILMNNFKKICKNLNLFDILEDKLICQILSF